MADESRTDLPDGFGHFRLVEELGQGGMGTVYVGIDDTLERRVALKVIRAEHRLDPERKARLLREAQILSRLDHPGICQLHDYVEGEHADCLVLELVDGTSLRRALDEAALDDDRKLAVAGQLLDVLVAVHAQGIIHRDLTPNNVMLTPSLGVKVLDFGLARTVPTEPPEELLPPETERRPSLAPAGVDESAVDASSGSITSGRMTAHGTVVGTAGYMSPEQARGQPATTASDMYSFGLILQEMFTGRSPYAEKIDAGELRRRTMWAETEPVTGVAGDLATLIKRLTSLAPALRPSSVDAAKMLQEVVDGPRRRRRRVMVAAVWLTLAVFGLGMTVQYLRAEREAARARRARIAAEQQRAGTLAEAARAAAVNGDPLEARAKLRESLEVQDTSAARAVWWQLEHRPLHWSKKLNAAIMGVAFSPDGTTVAAANSDGSIVLLDVQTRASRTLRGADSWVRAVAYSPDGSELYSTSNEGRIGIWDLRTASVRYISSVSSDSIAVCSGPRCLPTEGSLLATSGRGGAVLFWDSGTLSQVRSFEDTAASRFCFSPDGGLVAFKRIDGSVELRDTTSGQRLWRQAPTRGMFRDARFAPDGALLGVAGSEGDVHLFETNTGAEIAHFGGGQSGITALRFLPSGERLVSVAMDHSMSLWEVSTGKRVATFPAHDLWIYGLDASPDGRYVASSSEDGTVSLWRTGFRRALPEDRGHPAEGFGLTFSPDGSRLFSSARDRTIRSWDVATGDALEVLRGHAGTVYAVACDPTGTVLASAGDYTVRLWRSPFDPITQPALVLEMPGAAFDVGFTRDGSRIAAVSNDGTIRLSSLDGVFESRQLPRQAGVDQQLRFGPDGRWLASGDATSGVVRLWDLVTGRPGPTWDNGVRNATGLCFSRDGRRIALGEATGAVHLWSIETGTATTVPFPGHRVATVVAHPDGALCLLESPSRTMSLHNLETGKTVPLEGSLSQTHAACSSDGRWLATIGSNGRVHLWDPETGRPAWRTVALLRSPFDLLTHRGWVSLDGVETRGRGTLQWRAALEDRALVADQSEDGRWLCMMDHQGTLELWDLDGDARSWGHRVPKALDLRAFRDGCVVRDSEGDVSLIRPPGEVTLLTADGSAMEVSAAQIFVALVEGIAVFDSGGDRVSVLPAPPGVTSIGAADAYLAVASADGTILFLPRSPNAAHPMCTIEDLPSSRIGCIVMGPRNTIVVGFENGTLGIWNLDDGDLLHRTHLNGAIRHIVLHRDVLGFATQAGDFDTLDLRLFGSPYCEVLCEVWHETGVVWENGRPERRPIPEDHACWVKTPCPAPPAAAPTESYGSTP